MWFAILTSILTLFALILVGFAITLLVMRGNRYQEKRTKRLINSILKPLAKPVPKVSLEPTGHHPIPSPAYKRFNWRTFFRATDIALERREEGLFFALRQNVFKINEDEYRALFRTGTLDRGGNLGFSGAAFFFTPNGKKYIVKSLPNEFEWTFFYRDLLVPYCFYLMEHSDSLLSRITDALFNFDYRFWNLVRMGAASHFLVMPNILEGFDEKKGCREWDLKPKDYLRADLLMPMSDEESERLLFKKGGLSLTQQQFDELMALLETDTKFLSDKKVVDYSFLLASFPIDSGIIMEQPPKFRTGVPSADGKYIYRLAIIDFFFSHRTAPSIIQNAGDIIPGDTEFTFTDKPFRYRQKFLEMVKEYVSIQAGQSHASRLGQEQSQVDHKLARRNDQIGKRDDQVGKMGGLEQHQVGKMGGPEQHQVGKMGGPEQHQIDEMGDPARPINQMGVQESREIIKGDDQEESYSNQSEPSSEGFDRPEVDAHELLRRIRQKPKPSD